VTDPEVEELLRETFQSREAQAPPLSLVRPKPRRTPWIAAGVGTLAVLAGAIVGANAMRSPAPVTLNAPSASPTTRNPAPGWRWESSLGVEIQVPDSWTVNEFGCNMTDRPTVVRGDYTQFACAKPEPATKEVALIGTGTITESPNARVVVIDGVAALRHEWRYTDGRFAGTVTIAARDVGLSVRTTSADLTNRILDSVRLVDVDHLGCVTTLTTSAPSALTPMPGRPVLPPAPSRLAICFYAGEKRLQSSIEVAGTDAETIFAGIRSAKEGPNPDPPKTQCSSGPAAEPDVVILPDGGVPLTVVFSPCTGRGVTDGRHWAHVNTELVGDMMVHTHTGWGYLAPLE
jgi:hypothetical protein